jgi:hypothetical protein
MGRQKNTEESKDDFAEPAKSKCEFKITRVYDPSTTVPRELDAYNQTELDRLLGSGWLIKSD